MIVALASLFVAVGWIGAGLANTLPALYVSYALGGIGAGAVYGGCVGVAMKWFPDRRGLCVGIVAGSYGFGTALTALPIDHMIKSSGYRSAFITWGIIQGVVVMIAAQFIKMPPAGWLPTGWDAIKAKVQRRVVQATCDDSRVTTIGRLLRSSSIDELPQLWNVLRGEMALVGPRPPMPSEVELYEAHHYARFDVKPGMTGPWQVAGRNDLTDFEEIVALESEYIRNWSLARDMSVMLKTIPVVLRMRGAH